MAEKPPEYESVVMAPPDYDDAIKLNPMMLIHSQQSLDAVPSYEYATSSSSLRASSAVLPPSQPLTTIEIVNEVNSTNVTATNSQTSQNIR